MQVAHYLDADLQPWAAALAAALFVEPAFPAAGSKRGWEQTQLGANAAQAEAEPASTQSELWQAAWQRLDELERLGGAAGAVLRAWRRPLREQLLLTPAEWQPALIGNHTVGGVLELDAATAAACRGAMHGLHDVHSLSLDFSGRHQSPPTTCLLYTSPSPRDRTRSRMPSSA